ncbi:MAG: hypothetical protein R3Y43_07785 [Alphaproteobacteria bacterium]
MIKGLRALFSSKIIFNPFVLLGICYGFYLYRSLELEDIIVEYKKTQIYLLVLILSSLYNVFVKKHYKYGGFSIDWSDTFLAILGGVFKFVLASVLAISFMYFLFF